MAIQRLILPGLALALALVPGSARAETRPPYGGTVTGALLGEPVTLDPVRARTHAEITLVSLVFDTLYHAGPEQGGTARLIPHLAAALPAVSASGLEVRIPLRHGITFHDGTPLGAGDVAASLRRVAAGEPGWLLAPVAAIDTQGNDIVLRLRRPAPALGLALTAPATSITPAGRPPRADAAVGSGPFALRRLDRRRRHIVLAAADHHVAGRPYLDTLELRWFAGALEEATAYEIGTLHLSLRGAVAYAGHTPKYQTREVTGAATVLAHVGFCAGGALRNPEARQALSLSLDREGFRGIGTGERVVPTVHPAPVALDGPATPAAAQRAHLDRARRALSAAVRADDRLRGRIEHRDGLALLVDRARPDDREIAENVAAALFRLGVTARIAALDAAALDARVRQGNCDLYIGQMALPAPSEALALAAAFAAGGDDWARARLAQAPLDLAAARRAFAQRLPIVPLFHRAVHVHHRDDVRGMALDHAARLSYADLFFFGRPAPSR